MISCRQTICPPVGLNSFGPELRLDGACCPVQNVQLWFSVTSQLSYCRNVRDGVANLVPLVGSPSRPCHSSNGSSRYIRLSFQMLPIRVNSMDKMKAKSALCWSLGASVVFSRIASRRFLSITFPPTTTESSS
jgi:hypothetical protein